MRQSLQVSISRLSAEAMDPILNSLRVYTKLRHDLMAKDNDFSSAALREAVRQMHTNKMNVLRHTRTAARFKLVSGFTTVRLTLLLALEQIIDLVGGASVPIAAYLEQVGGDTGLERWAHRSSWVLRQFFSYQSILNTGVETSVGFRFVIPGTGGLGANAGLWVMMYSGTLRDYLAQAVPMRINPGATLATAFFVTTLNRPGFGFGPSVPWGNAYVDAYRYKLLVGFDGVGYVRTGEWRGRGAYSTISGSLPFMPAMRFTWNASVFSPGFVPLVSRTTPAAMKLQKHAETLTSLFSKNLFRS
jgi:hypothetical protein